MIALCVTQPGAAWLGQCTRSHDLAQYCAADECLFLKRALLKRRCGLDQQNRRGDRKKASYRQEMQVWWVLHRPTASPDHWAERDRHQLPHRLCAVNMDEQ